MNKHFLPLTILIGLIAPVSVLADTGDYFSASPAQGNVPLTVSYSGVVNSAGSCSPTAYTVTLGGIEARQIDVPSGTCAPMPFNFSHVYNTAGSFTIALYKGSISDVQQGQSTHIQTSALLIHEARPTVPDRFSATPASGTAPLTVTFSGLVNGNNSCEASAYTVTLGGSEARQIDVPMNLCAAKEFSFQYTYTAAGGYTIALYKGSIPQVQAGQYTKVQESYIQVNAPTTTTAPEYFSASPASGVAPLVVRFTGVVNTSRSCAASAYTVTTGTGQTPVQVDVPAGFCAEKSFDFTQTYQTAGNFAIGLYRGSISQVQAGQSTEIQRSSIAVQSATTPDSPASGQYTISGTTMFPNRNALLPSGITYSHTVPDTLDLAQRAAVFIQGATKSTLPSYFYAPAHAIFNEIAPGETSCSPSPCFWNGSPNWGNMMRALARARTMTSADRNDASGSLSRQYTMLTNMLSFDVHQNIYNATGFPRMITRTSEELSPIITQTTHAMEAVAEYAAQGLGNTQSGLADFIRMHQDKIQSETVGGVPYAVYYTGLESDSEQGTVARTWPAYIQGRGASGLIEAYKASGNTGALTLSRRLIDYLMNGGGGAPASGVFTGQIYAHLEAALALLMDAQVRMQANPSDAMAQQEIARARAVYDFAKTQTRAGLVGNFGETGTAATMVRMAILFSELGAGNRYDEAEYWVRNQLAEAQIDAAALGSLGPLGNSVLGMFYSDATHVFTIPLNRNFRFNVDGPSNVMFGLAEVWKNTVLIKGNQANVNFLINHVSPYLVVRSDLPYRGKVEVQTAQSLGPIQKIAVRTPSWVLDTSTVTVTKRGEDGVETTLTRGTDWSWSGAYALINSVQPNVAYAVKFPIRVHTASVYQLRTDSVFWYEGSYAHSSAPEVVTQYTGRFRGYELVSATRNGSPVVRGSGIPRYQRDALAALPDTDVPPPTKTVEAFVVGGSSLSIPRVLPATPITTTPVPTPPITPPMTPPVVTPSMQPIAVTPSTTYYCPALTTDLEFGDRDGASGQVTELQRFLADYYNLNEADTVTGFFGETTRANVQRFQNEQGIVPAEGYVGAVTRAKIATVCGGTSTPGEAPALPDIPTAPSGDTPQSQGSQHYCPALSQDLAPVDVEIFGWSSAGSKMQVLELQKFLADYYNVDSSDIVTGYFGRLTLSKVQQFQREHDIEPAAGYVGPVTRAKIAQVCAGEVALTPVSPQVANAYSALIETLKALLERLK